MAVQTISAFGLAAQITDNSTSFDRYEQTANRRNFSQSKPNINYKFLSSSYSMAGCRFWHTQITGSTFLKCCSIARIRDYN